MNSGNMLWDIFLSLRFSFCVLYVCTLTICFILDDSAVVSSGEDSVSPPSSQENKTTGKRKRKVFSVSTLFRGAK